MYTGSCNAHSTTAKLAEQLVSTIDEITKVDVAADFYSGSNTLIKECVGCTQCFIQGRCALDARDDMPVLRQKMMEADCIILEYRDNAAEIRKWLDNGYTSYSGFDAVIRDRFFPDKYDK